MLDHNTDIDILNYINLQYDGSSASIVEAYYNKFLDTEKSKYHSDYYQDREWIDVNDRKKFLKNIKTHPELDFYIDNPLIYRINNCFHRSKALLELPNTIDLFLGDSTSFGEGVVDEHSWVTRLGKFMDFPYYNGSIGGSGIMSCYRVLRQVSSYRTIRNLYILGFLGWPRYEYYDPYDKTFRIEAISDYGYTDFEKSVIHDANLSTMYIAYHTLIQEFCKKMNIKLYFVFNQEVSLMWNERHLGIEYKDLKGIPARDLLHPSPTHHAKIFETFKTKIIKDDKIIL